MCLCKTSYLWDRTIFDPSAIIWTTLRKVHKMKPHTKYQKTCLLFSDKIFKVLPIGVYVKKMTFPEKKSRSTQGHQFFNLYWAHVPNAAYQVPRSLALWFRRQFLKAPITQVSYRFLVSAFFLLILSRRRIYVQQRGGVLGTKGKWKYLDYLEKKNRILCIKYKKWTTFPLKRPEAYNRVSQFLYRAKNRNPTIGKIYGWGFVYIKLGYWFMQNRCTAMQK